ncbi:hypothetical protein, partial [uncultured Bacteroides sp.]|uniref:hypothetical protein n=1 Tax=uncultured Bacteroides sp. TaxID=162156 RepID=UPI00259768F7
ETLTKIAAQNLDGYLFRLYLLSRTVVLLIKGAAFIFHSLKKYEKTNTVHRNILSVMFYESGCLLLVH